MKKKYLFLLPVLFALFFLSGCSDNTADKYVKEQITSLKEESTGSFSLLLEDGIAASKEKYQFTLDFPEELKEPYTNFLMEAFKTIEFEVQKADKSNDTEYTVILSFTPIDIAETTEAANSAYTETIASSDLNAEVLALLEQDMKALAESPVYNNKVLISIDVKKKGDSYSITDESMKNFLNQALSEYMAPYETVCQILDAQSFMKAYLDASFKGEVAEFAKHTGRTEEEALEWYESDVFTPPSDLTSSYKDRYVKALKKVMKQCKYSVGIPKKEDGLYNYTITVTLTPNNSIKKTYKKLESGTYYSAEAVSKALVETLEKYADSPAYGKETTVTISLNMSSIISAGESDAEFTKLGQAILPIPEQK